MAKTHDDKNRDSSEEVTIAPVMLTSVKLKTITKEIISPKLIPVDVEKPNFIDKNYERPVPVDKKYERPVITDKSYERPVVTDREYEKPVIVEKDYERPVLIDKDYEKPVIVEKEYPIPVPKNVEYDLPVVSMDKVKEIASEAVSVLSEAKNMLKDVTATTELLKATIAQVKESIPEEIVMPNMIYEDYTVKNVTIEEETVHVIGKIVARGK